MMTLESRNNVFHRALSWIDRWTLDTFNTDRLLTR